MFFILSKVLWFVVAPGNLILLLLVVGIVVLRGGRRRSHLGGSLIVIGVMALIAAGILPAGNLLMRTLEDRFPQPALAQDFRPAGIIVLGGAIDQIVGQSRGQVTIADSATRLTEGAILARRFPDAPLLYTGGSASLVAEIGSEADDARRLWIDLGVDPSRILIEDKSRNTEENARFTRDLVHPSSDRTFILVTSAYHMPRSVGLFRAAGFTIVPDPVDYRTSGTWRDLEPARDLVKGLAQFSVALREWIGLVSYRATGKIAELFPAP